MNFQKQVSENAADLRARAMTFADLALVRARAALSTQRVATLKASLTALQIAGRELNQVARRHVSRFVKENSVIARDAGKDVTALARATYSSLAKQGARPARKNRKTAAARKRTARTRRAAVKVA